MQQVGETVAITHDVTRNVSSPPRRGAANDAPPSLILLILCEKEISDDNHAYSLENFWSIIAGHLGIHRW